MAMYLLYDRHSGRIVHRHRQTGNLPAEVVPSRERLLKLAAPSVPAEQLDILAVEDDAMKRDRKYRVNPQTKALEAL
ncbi:MAG TPA: hypothetical protein VFA07_14245 [Chthonomonadaceae bacterium]|nr:hypothetical protein [Chthonomonadaceae bacterium]